MRSSTDSGRCLRNGGRARRCGALPAIKAVGCLCLLSFLWLAPEAAHAARIGDVGDPVSVGEQALRFLTFSDPALRFALAGALLLGLNCGLLGSFIVVRRMALVGDTLSHAVLPGIALGFLWGSTKDPVAILVGATVVGMLGILVSHAITRTTRLKQDTALGIVLASFYAVGICLVDYIQRTSTGNMSGIKSFLFGQASALSGMDVALMAGTSTVTVLGIIFLHGSLVTTCFDRGFAGAIGLPVRLLERLLMLLTAFAIVVAMQAAGVVLVSALLVIPASTAYLLADRMPRMLGISAVAGMLSAASGAFFSFLGNNLPTGPLIVLSAAVLFVFSFLFAPRHGWLTGVLRRRSRWRKTRRENTLKAIYKVLEDRQFHGEDIPLLAVAELRRESFDEVAHRVRDLVGHGLVTLGDEGESAYFTPDGLREAARIVRNHRLWELYLTTVADYPADHVHEDAEEIEHVLGADTVRQLERLLSFPTEDPHGKPIPAVPDPVGSALL